MSLPAMPLMQSFLAKSTTSIDLYKIGLNSRLRARWVAVGAGVISAWLGSVVALAAPTDYVRQQLPRAPLDSGRVSAQHAFIFGEPAYWPATLRWRYNPAGAPAQFSANKSATIQQLIDAAAKWKAACGVDIVYDGETTSAPNAMVNGVPDRVNVVGWQAPQGGVMAATSTWTDSGPSGDVFVDADISLSPSTLSTPQLLASLVAHEWGHAIGLGHSATSDTLMAGPPDAAYSNATGLAADDVQGCRCLYGPPAGAQAGFVCSLPTKIDFDPVAVGAIGAPRELRVTNDGSATMRINSVQIAASDFAVTGNQCAGRSLAPGTTCTFSIQPQPTSTGMRGGEAIIDTSEGPYRFPLRVEGIAALASPTPPSTLNIEGPWWNPSESGWGLNLAHQDDVIFTTWFTYDANGQALWLSMTAFRTSATAYAGTLYRTTGPSLQAVPFDSTQVQRVEVGTGSLNFTDGSNGTFAYTVNGVSQTKPITRLVFGPLPTCTFGGQSNLAPATNYQGNWWSGESGWGVYLTHQGANLFTSWFTYDSDGTPLWLSATAARNANGTYGGTVYRTTGPVFSSVPFNPQAVTRTPVGSITLSFANGNSARFDYTVTVGATTASQSKLLSRLVFRTPGTVCQ